ncbi:MAG TPA: hypothetical protein VL443_27390 [Cyclobacteriaceae bacterium]|jgi:hypothetical protein|nr:hypothetical protein [Cyclobacteriaceae bacterium]
MLVHDPIKKQLKVEIEISNIEELHSYQNGIRGILRTIEIASCNQELKENLKAVYQLLSHLQPEHALVSNNNSSQHNLDPGNA